MGYRTTIPEPCRLSLANSPPPRTARYEDAFAVELVGIVRGGKALRTVRLGWSLRRIEAAVHIVSIGEGLTLLLHTKKALITSLACRDEEITRDVLFDGRGLG